MKTRKTLIIGTLLAAIAAILRWVALQYRSMGYFFVSGVIIGISILFLAIGYPQKFTAADPVLIGITLSMILLTQVFKVMFVIK